MRLSIITVCYNAALTIENTLISVKKLKEVDKNIEYIIVDGKSKDDTNTIISKYKDIVDKYISEPDKGLYDALNKGIKLSSSEWVMLLAADDCIIVNGIQSFRKTLKSETEIWCGSVVCRDCNGYYIFRSSNELDKLKNNCVLRNPASVFRKSIFEKYGYYDTDFKCNGDGELFYRMYINKVKFQIEDVPMVVFGMDGMSSDSIKYAIPERAMIYEKYGLKSDKDIIKWEKKAIKKARIKQLLKKIKLVRMLTTKRKNFLSKEDLAKIGITEYIHNY